MGIRVALAFLFVLAAGRAVLLDRIAVTVGKNVVTENDIDQEVRITAFLNGEPLDQSVEARKQAAERLVDQTLIRSDMQLSNWPQPETSEAGRMLAQVKRERFGGDAPYRKALARYGITEVQLIQHLLWQIAALRYTDFRFRPGIPAPAQALQKHLERETRQRSAENARSTPGVGQIRLGQARRPPPRTDEAATMDQAQPGEPARTAEKPVPEDVDQQMDAWLKEARARARIVYHPEAFR